MTDKKLHGKVAIVTGGSSGIGLAIAQRFVEHGAYVFITGRKQEALDDAKAVIGRNVTTVPGDVTNLADLERLFQLAKASKGHIDIVVANAGEGEFAPLGAIAPEFFDRQINLNLRAVLFTVQGALPLLRDGASIILVGSIAGSKGFPAFSVYGAAKAGLRSFARTWTMELKGRRIRTNVLSPGPVNTARFIAAPEEVKAGFIQLVPMARASETDEIAKVALFLASDDSSYVTGIELFADGGTAQV